MKFGENLYNLRKSAKMSQDKLAEKMNVSRQSVSKWENGESYPEMEKIMKLCDIFHCKINDLVHEDMVDIDSLDEDVKMSVVKFKEEKQRKIKGISKAVYILARIGKIVLTMAISVILFLVIFTPIFISNIEIKDDTILFFGKRIDDKITIEKPNDDVKLQLEVNGSVIEDENNQDEIEQIKSVLENNSKVKIIAYVEIGYLCSMVCLVLYRMTLSRLEKLFININEGDTPFTLENVRYIKQMAFLMIASIIFPNISGIFFELILKLDLGIGLELFDVIQILFLFGMSYIFEYGYELQQDTKAKMYGTDNE